MRCYKVSSAWLVAKICYMSMRIRKWEFSPKNIPEAMKSPQRYKLFGFWYKCIDFISFIIRKTSPQTFKRTFMVFSFFGKIYNLGGRGSILATGTTKTKLGTWNLRYSTPKHCSFIKLQQKSARHHSFDLTTTDMQFSPRKWRYVQTLHSWRQGRQFQIHPNLFFVWVYIRLYEKGKETYISGC